MSSKSTNIPSADLDDAPASPPNISGLYPIMALVDIAPPASSTSTTTIALEVVATNNALLDEFLLFPKLPVELRLKVWNMRFVPRRVHIYPYIGKDETPQSPEVPSTLLVNHESRDETMKHYHLLSYNAGWYNNTARVPVWRHPALDVLVDSSRASTAEKCL